MRVILITSKLNFEPDGSPVGGSVVDLHFKALGLHERGHEVTVITAFSEADRIPCALPYRVFRRRVRGRGLIGLQRGVYALLKEFEERADVFYVDGHMFLYGAGAYRMCGGVKPVAAFFNVRLNLWADVSMEAVRLSLYRRLKKSARRFLERSVGLTLTTRLDAFIFNTPMVERLYRDFGFARGARQSIIPDFVATAALSKKYGMTPETIGKRQNGASPIRVLATGRMIPEKGFDLVIRAFAQVPDKERYFLTISGDGPDRARLEQLVRALHLESRVSFPGWIPASELHRLLTQTHIFVFPKWWIEYGSALFTEVMALGIPSVIPRGGALEWLSGGSALTFKYDDSEALAECLIRLGQDERLRIQLGERALVRAKELDYTVLAVRLERVLTECVTPPEIQSAHHV